MVNLRQMRAFYLTYSIQQTVSAELPAPKFQLSWSHYLKLMRMTNLAERSFYEIECVANNWSLRELQKQFDSALYERLALSRDKEAVKQLALQGQRVAKTEDMIKEPYVLEFLGLETRHAYSETELKQAIIDKITHFLKELGKGFK